MDSECRICGHVGSADKYFPREMMFGTKERFDYFQCRACGCLQINAIPSDMSRHYPLDYFSFVDYSWLMKGRLRGWIERFRVSSALRQSGRGKTGLMKYLPVPAHMEWINYAGVTREDPILDVGCGSGKVLVRLGLGGFRECIGVDPYLSREIIYSPHVRIYNKSLDELAQRYPKHFALIMLHHSFEHMADPHAVLEILKTLLRPGGCLLIRIPLAEGHAWEIYKEDWVQLDAPRHFYLHTRKSMQVLAQQHGFVVKQVTYDSGPTQVLGSELYRHDVALMADKKTKDRVLGPALKKSAATLAKELNAAERGDQAAFFLTVN